ncbi:MAG: hypothetical protein DRR11_15740 [Gammaproteobacteria bacterium]|nr:MAG: hypothetical protein DRR11_15740 [Gammaproteobacteria bacterium]RLA49529.1 MAG: hypothetical protein DRR42_15500 [Gammaproteobacteria bacterium]
MSQTYSATETFSVIDVEVVMRRVTADLVMIASSTGAVTENRARDWGHDIEALAKNGYLQMVDLTLMSNGIEQKAKCFEVNTEAGGFTMSRPGGVLWPKVSNPELQIVLYYTTAYDAAAKEKMGSKLRIGWVPTSADTGHATLTASASRDYVSNGYGMQRRDFS